MTTPFENQLFRHSVSQIAVRAESQQSLQRLAETFVDPGVTEQLINDNSQIIYGRRGTGKTHILKFIEQGIEQRGQDKRLVLFLDMRILGSGSINAEEGRPPHIRATSILRDILERIHSKLLAYITDPKGEIEAGAVDALDKLATATQRTVLKNEELVKGASESHAEDQSAGLEMALSTRPELRLKAGGASNRQQQSTVERSGQPQQALYYQEVGQALNDVLDSCKIENLTLLLDEWTAVPMEIQPLLADYLKRCFLAHPRICLKVASIRHRSQFQTQIGDNRVGFEVGADVAATLELDENFVFEGNRKKSLSLFAELLHRHIQIEATQQAAVQDYLQVTYGIKSASDLVETIFTGSAFTELVRAGEGIPRDFIQIFSKAFFNSVGSGASQIDAGAIRVAANEWYGIDKSENLDTEEEELFNLISGHVVGKHRVTSFAVRKRQERHRLICELVDLRLFHLVRRNWMRDQANPGDRWTVFRIDYGSYAPLMGTKRAPRLWSPNSKSIQLPSIDNFLSHLPS